MGFQNEGSFITEGGVDTSVDMAIQNSGLMQLDATTLTIEISFTQDTAATLKMPILDPPETDNSHSQVIVTGAINLDGTLKIELAENFVPEIGTSYKLLLGDTLTGTFATINGLEIAPDRKFKVVYNSKDAILNVVAIL